MSEPFKLKILTDEGDISFGRRVPGQVGKDILAVKLALGVIKSVDGLLEIADHPANEQINSIPLDDYGWFDCTTGKRLTLQQAATFDQKTEIALINYQTSNQFLIICYMFQKYSARSIIAQSSSDDPISYAETVFREHTAAKTLFDTELGIIGESTLAILHGWLPYTQPGNKGYYHGSRYNPTFQEHVYDIITPDLQSDLRANRLGQSAESLLVYGPGLQPINGNKPDLAVFYSQVSETEKWIPRENSLDFGTVLYDIKLEPVESGSLLYDAARTSINSYNTREIETTRALTEEELNRRSHQMYYPDPFTTRDPFYINETKEGFYLETDFVLDAQGPVPNHLPETLLQLEDLALERVLEYYDKPKVWFLQKNDEFVKIKYFAGQTPPDSEHVGWFPREIPEAEKQLIPYYRGIKVELDFVNRMLDESFEEWRVQEALEQRGLPDPETGEYDTVMLSDNRPENWSEDGNPESFGYGQEGQLQLLERWNYWNGRKSRAEARYILPLTAEDNKKYFYVLGSPEGQQFESDDQGSVFVDSWRLVENYGRTDPLVKFVEYKTPTLRPGQRYMAFFEINREKLNLITNGVYPSPEPATAVSTASTQPDIDVPGCASTSAEESKRILEEQRAHARAKRRQIVRQIRERLAREEEYHRNPSVNLPEIGPFDLNSAVGRLLGSAGSGTSDYEYSKLVLSTMGEIGETVLNSIPGIKDIDRFNSISSDFDKEISADDAERGSTSAKKTGLLEIDLEELKLRIETAVKDLKDSESILRREGVTYAQGSKFSSSREISFLNQTYTDLQDIALKAISDSTATVENPSTKSTLKKEYVSYAQRNLDEVKLLITFTTADRTAATGQLGPLIGSKINGITLHYPTPPRTDLNTGKRLKGRQNIKSIEGTKINSEPLTRPRTVHYIRKIKEMTGLLTSRPNSIKPLLGDARGSCSELGVNLEKRQAYSFIASYTTGVKANPSKTLPIAEAFTSTWKEEFVNPWDQWWSQTKSNASNTIDMNNFDEAQALRQFGELCSLEELYVEFFSKLSLPSLFCDWLKCIRFPGFDLKLPSFYFPPLPSIPIVGWYGGLVKFFYNNWSSILKRLACTMAKILIDKLAMPFCQEQLDEFITAGLTTTQPYLREAIIDSIKETGIADGKEEEAKNLFEDISNICTPNEFCDLLEGKNLDDAAMLMVQRLVEKNGLDQDLYSKDAIVNYFGVIGTYLPFDLCEQIRRSAPPAEPKNCIELSSYLTNIRNRLTTGDSTLTDQEIEQVIETAKEENKKLEEQLRAFSGGNIGDSLPTAYAPGDPNAVVSDYPDWMKDQMNRTINGCFSETKSSYIRSLRSYIPTMSIPIPRVPRAGDDYYQDIEALRLEAAATQLAMYTAAVESSQKISQQFQNAYFDFEEGESVNLQQIENSAAKTRDSAVDFQMAINQNISAIQRLQTNDGTYNNRRLVLAEGMEVWTDPINPAWRPTEDYNKHMILSQQDRENYTPSNSEGSQQFHNELPIGDSRWTSRHSTFIDMMDIASGWITEATERSLPKQLTEIMMVEEQDEEGNVVRVENEFIYYELQLVTPFDVIEEKWWNLRDVAEPAGSKEYDIALLTYFLAGYEFNQFKSILDEKVEQLEEIISLGSLSITGSKALLLWSAFEYETVEYQDANGNTKKQFVHKRYRVKDPDNADFVVALRIDEAGTDEEEEIYGFVHQASTEYVKNRYKMLSSPFTTHDAAGDVLNIGLFEAALELRTTRNTDNNAIDTHPDAKMLYGVVQDASRPMSEFLEKVSYDEYYDSISDPEKLEQFVLSTVPLEYYDRLQNRAIASLRNDDGAIDFHRWLGLEDDLPDYYKADPNLASRANMTVILNPSGPLPIIKPDDATSDHFLNGSMLISNGRLNTYMAMTDLLPRGQQRDRLHSTHDNEEDRKKNSDWENQIMSQPANSPELLQVIQKRINNLTRVISDVFENRPEIVEARHLEILEKVYRNQGFLKHEGISLSGHSAIELSLGLGVYAPKIKIADIPAGRQQDRFDVEITSDLHLRQIGDQDKKIFKFCDGLPANLVQYNADYPAPYFSKREAFAKMVMRNSNGVAENLNINELVLKGTTFEEIRNSIIQYIFEKAKNSRLFDPDYASEVHDRTSGRPDYSSPTNCVRNRYGLVDASILAFEKTILRDNHKEFMKEISKPENSQFNRDFDDISPIELAIQNMAFKAFVRVCLLDTMLKGGLAYAIWDIEPVVSSSVFIEYAFEHVRIELDRNRAAKDLWKEIAERAMEIDNPLLALRKIVQEELTMLPDYSKQIFSPNNPEFDYFNWYMDSSVPQVQLSPEVSTVDESYELGGNLFPRQNDPWGTLRRAAGAQRDSFYLQVFVSIAPANEVVTLPRPVIEALQSLGTRAGYAQNQGNRVAFSIQNNYLETSGLGNKICLSEKQFEEFVRTLKSSSNRTNYESTLNLCTIKYGVRLILATPLDLGTQLGRSLALGENWTEIYARSNVEGTHFSVIDMNNANNPGFPSRMIIQNLPILDCETDISIGECPNIYFGEPHEIGVVTPTIGNHTIKCMKEKEEFGYLFDNIFNITRYLSIFSMFATSTMQGYNGMVGLFEGSKTSLGFLMKLASTPASEQFSSLGLSPQDFQSLMEDNFPVDPEDAGCFGVPIPDLQEFFNEFYKQLKKMIKELPSVFFRGVASVLDPAYKEMRQHYYNCDIKDLTHSGLDYQAGAVDSKLINGLHRRSPSHGNRNGRYVPLESSLIDLVNGISTLSMSRINKTVLKMVTYAYSGPLPLLDPSAYFSIPCAPSLDKKWHEGGPYDLGQYGRYGHPTTPFTHFALMTDQLQRDKDKQSRSCIIINEDPPPNNEC